MASGFFCTLNSTLQQALAEKTNLLKYIGTAVITLYLCMLNEAKTLTFQPGANFLNFEIHLDSVCQPGCHKIH